MNVYRHPESYRPALRFGGHEFEIDGVYGWCRCGAVLPLWAIREDFWVALVPRLCLLKVAALGPSRGDG